MNLHMAGFSISLIVVCDLVISRVMKKPSHNRTKLQFSCTMDSECLSNECCIRLFYDKPGFCRIRGSKDMTCVSDLVPRLRTITTNCGCVRGLYCGLTKKHGYRCLELKHEARELREKKMLYTRKRM